MLTEELRSALLALPAQPPDTIPEAYKFSALYNRPERILIGGRRTGKSVLARHNPQTLFPSEPTSAPYLGLIDDSGDPEKTLAQIIAANRFERDQKNFAPRYRWTALVRDTTWARIGSRLGFMGPSVIGQFAFIAEDYWDWLPPAARTELGLPWLRVFFDAHKRFMPEVAYMAALQLPHSTSAMHAQNDACHDWVLQQTDLASRLTWVIPEAQVFAGSKFVIMRKREVLSRLLSYSRRVAPSLGAEFYRVATAAGVWHERTRGRCSWSQPWAIGAATIRRRLTAAQLKSIHGV